MIKKKDQKKIDAAYKEGYEMGVKNALYQEDKALKIGRAILDILDTRYEFAKEDYD